jgi:hypothetical protein
LAQNNVELKEKVLEVKPTDPRLKMKNLKVAKKE